MARSDTRFRLGRSALLRIAAGLVLLALAAAAGWTLAARALQARIVEALGPESEVDAISFGPGGVRIDGLRVRAPPGWPSPRTLSARRVTVVPELRTLLSDRVRIARVTIEDASLSVLRTGDGRLRMLPRLSERAARIGGADGKVAADAPSTGTPDAAAGPSGAARSAGAPPAVAPRTAPVTAPRTAPGTAPASVVIGRVTLRGGTLEFFDVSVGKPPRSLRVRGVEAELDDLVLPAMDARSALRLHGEVDPARRDVAPGRLSIEGELVVATRDSRLRTTLRGVDLVALQPWISRAAEARIGGGTLDLDLASDVAAGRLRAPGRIVLHGLAIAPSTTGTFMGLPHAAVVALLKDRSDRIELDFVLDGRLDDPRFSLTDDLVLRVATELAAKLGGPLGELLRDAGGVGRRAVDALRGLFGR